MNFMSAFIREEEGVTVMEYSLIVALVSVMIIAGAGTVGTELNGTFQRLANCIQNSAPCNNVV
jgi:pilus assembly protein Flp/PilA